MGLAGVAALWRGSRRPDGYAPSVTVTGTWAGDGTDVAGPGAGGPSAARCPGRGVATGSQPSRIPIAADGRPGRSYAERTVQARFDVGCETDRR